MNSFRMCLFGSANLSERPQLATVEQMQKQMQGVRSMVKDHRQSYFFLMCDPQHRQGIERLLVEAARREFNSIRRINVDETRQEGAAICVSLNSKPFCRPEQFSELILTYSHHNKDLIEEPLQSFERTQIKELLAWQKNAHVPDGVPLTKDLRGAVAEVIMCRIFDGLEHKYGKPGVNFLRRSSEPNHVHDEHCKTGKSVEFITRHNCALRTGKGKLIEIDGIVRAGEELMYLADASTSLAAAKEKYLLNRLKAANKTFVDNARMLHVLFSYDKGKEHNPDQHSWSVILPWREKIWQKAEKLEKKLAEKQKTEPAPSATDSASDVELKQEIA